MSVEICVDVEGHKQKFWQRSILMSGDFFFSYILFFSLLKFSVLFFKHIYFWQPDTNIINYSYPLALQALLGNKY